MVSRPIRASIAGALLLLAGACTGGASHDDLTAEEKARGIVPVTIRTQNATHRFKAEPARTPEAQQRGLMFRTDLTEKSAMLFFPYPADGSGPREASFWMKDTPTALDIVFIRPDGVIANIERGEPFVEAPVTSTEPVGAVLEVKAGVAEKLGIAAGDRVSWPDGPQSN